MNEHHEHVTYLRNVLADLEELSGILGQYVEHRWRLHSVLDRLARSGSPERARAGLELAEQLILKGHLGSRGGYVIFFPLHGSDLDELDLCNLQSLQQSLAVLRFWITEPGARCVVTGHCSRSEDGSIALHRATVWRDYLVSQGVAQEYLTARAHHRPDACCPTADHDSDFGFRRAELHISSMPRCFEVARSRESVTCAIAEYAKNGEST